MPGRHMPQAYNGSPPPYAKAHFRLAPRQRMHYLFHCAILHIETNPLQNFLNRHSKWSKANKKTYPGAKRS